MPRQDLIQCTRLAYQVACQQLPPYGSKFAPKKDTQPSLLACLCVKEYLKLDYRGLEALLVSAGALRAALELRAVPDHSMFHWFARHKVKPTMLKRMLETTTRLFPRRRNGRHTVALDATGLARHPTSRYSIARLKRWRQDFLMLSTVVWTKWLAICAHALRTGPGSHCRLLNPLVQTTLGPLPIARLVADPDYDSEANHRWLREDCAIESIIPATRGRPGRIRGCYRRRMQRYFPRRKYGVRWLAETVNSVLKRKFGEALTARRYWQQVKQAFLRDITYNLYRVVQLGLVFLRLMFHQIIRVSLVLTT